MSTSPRATVPGTRGRADIPSAKKSLGSSGSYLGCTAMRWRQPLSSSATRSAATRPPPAARRPLPRDICHLPRIERLQKIPGLVEIELRIARLNDEEEFIARCLIESRHIEHRVIGHWQPVERQHAENGSERSEQHCAFERDRNPGRPGVEWPPADVEGPMDHVRVPAHEEAAETSDDPPAKDDHGEP